MRTPTAEVRAFITSPTHPTPTPSTATITPSSSSNTSIAPNTTPITAHQPTDVPRLTQQLSSTSLDSSPASSTSSLPSHPLPVTAKASQQQQHGSPKKKAVPTRKTSS